MALLSGGGGALSSLDLWLSGTYRRTPFNSAEEKKSLNVALLQPAVPQSPGFPELSRSARPPQAQVWIQLGFQPLTNPE